ncbi:hypothetical protein JXD20_02370 [Candidatus Peregrinibacteria bacterium]|nr:hypothetical protein [Candidatus Peregrinibacteria bacterium]
MNLQLSRFKKLLPLFFGGVFLLSTQPALAEYFPENAAKPDPVAGQKQLQGMTVGEFTGSGIYEYPIGLPAGRNGMMPTVSLTYNSQDEALDNIVGYHWDITKFSIKRINKHGVEKLYNQNDFTANLPFESGELIVESLSDEAHGQYAQHFESNFTDYEFLPDNSWLVTDKQGNKYLFGVSEASRVFDPDDPSRVSEWMLEEIRDTNDNYIKYKYLKSGNRLYPYEINYTGHGAEDGIFKIEFFYEGRSDSHFSFATGFRIDSDLLINRIEIYVNETLRKKIEVGYTKIQDFNRNTVGSITETGYDKNGQVTALPPTTFEYTESDVRWEETTDYMPEWFFKTYMEDYGNSYPLVYMWDMTGDGLPDFEQIVSNNFNTPRNPYVRYVNDGKGGWKTTNAGYLTSIYTASLPNVGTKLVDFDGDTKTDIVNSWETNSIIYGRGGSIGNVEMGVKLGTSSQFQSDNGGNVADLNGDGLPDMIQGRAYFDYEEQAPSFSTCLNENGDSCPATELWKSPLTFIRDDLNVQYDRNAYIQDCNYDGLADIQTASNQYYLINDGKGGWISDAPGKCYFTMMDSLGNRSSDVNGDGLIDRIHAEQEILYVGYKIYNDIYINTGGVPSRGAEPLKNRFPVLLGKAEDTAVRIFDLNGDKLPDIMQSQQYSEQIGNDWITTETKRVWLNTGSRPYFLKTVHTSTGAEINIEYKTSAQYMKADGTQANPALPIIIDTVSRMTIDDGQGNISSTDYFYEDGHYYYKDPYDKSFAGFRVVTKTDGLGYKTKNYYHQSEYSVNDAANGEYADHISKKGRAYRTEAYDSNGQLVTATVNRFEHKTLDTDHYYPYLSQTLSQSFDGGMTKATAKAFTYDDIGNVIQVIDYGEVVSNQNGNFTDTGNDLLKTLISYVSQSAFPYENKTEGQSGTLLSDSKTYYDGLPLGQADKGNVTAQEAWLDSSGGWLRSEIEYNEYGLPTKTTNPRGYSATTEYDTYNLYPATITNAKGHSSQMTYDPGIGQPTTTIDPNGSVTDTDYDGLSRPVRTEKDGQLLSTTTYNDTSSPRSVHSTAFNDDGEKVEAYTYIDALGRTIESKQEAPGGKWITTQTIYDERGNAEKQIQPYFSSSANFESLNAGKQGTSFVYDALGRVLSAANSLGTTRTGYSGWEVTTTDPNGNSKTLANNARGNLIRVDERNGGQTYQTHYTYDPLGRLTQIRDAENNTRSFAYDSLGRRTFQSKLGSSAGWNYAYDENGNLTRKTDPKGQVTSLTYDELDRVLTENDMVFAYDQGDYAIGRLSKIWKPGYEHSFSYDLWGRVLNDHKQIEARTFDFAYIYDQMGAVTSMTYPDGAVADYRYDSAHQLERIEVGGKTFADSFQYTPMGQVTQMMLGNGVVVQNNYDENQLYRLTSKTAGDQLQDYSYTYDPVGNLLTLIDANSGITAKTVSYQYDDLYRLTQADYTNTANETDITQTYDYDPLGNMTYKSDVGQYVYDSGHPHAVTQAGSHTFAYDENGNMAVRDDVSMTYDTRDRLILSAGKASFTYGEGYERLTKTDLTTGGTTYYPNKYFEVHPEKEVKYIYAGDLRIAKIEKELAYTPPTPTPEPTPDPGTPTPPTNPPTDLQPADPTPTPSAPAPVVSQQGTGPATDPSGSGGSYGSQEELELMRLISEGQMEKARELSRQIYLYSLNSIEEEKKKTLVAGALPESVFENLRITYNRNEAIIAWDSMPKEITAFRIYRSKGNHAGPLEDTEIFLEEIEASRFGNRFVHQFDEPDAKYAYQIEALNEKGWSLLKSPKLHVRQVFIYEGQQKIVDFRNFSPTDFTHVRIKSNEFVDGRETSIPQRLILKPDAALEGGARLSVNFLTCDTKNDGSKICKKLDTRFIEVYVLNRGETVKKTITFLQKGVSRLAAAFTPNAYAETGDETSYYLLSDHLGSIDVVLDDQGEVIERRDYLPYGSERLKEAAPDSTETDYKFTGKELDDETGLHYYGARYYDSEIGRFVSVDPLLLSIGSPDFYKKRGKKTSGIELRQRNHGHLDYGHAADENRVLLDFLSNPQRLNVHAYVINNPVKFTDPNGEDEVHFSLTANAGLGASIGLNLSMGFAFDGSYGISYSYQGGGFAGGDASIGLAAGYSNAETWSDTEGMNAYMEVGGKYPFAGGGATTNVSQAGEIEGIDVGIGLGPATPIYTGAGISKTTVIIERNIVDDLNAIGDAVTDTANIAVDFAKESVEKLSSLFKDDD